jgi:hypothetical protein
VGIEKGESLPPPDRAPDHAEGRGAEPRRDGLELGRGIDWGTGSGREG